MQTKQCPYCHEQIEIGTFALHCQAHEHVRPDGQQEEYVTLAPESRSAQSLEYEPQVYYHKKCGAGTQMPEEIVRSYLVNPYLYLADSTFCTGCGKQVPNRECVWSETGENLQSYIDRLRVDKPEYRPGLVARVLVLLIHQKWI